MATTDPRLALTNLSIGLVWAAAEQTLMCCHAPSCEWRSVQNPSNGGVLPEDPRCTRWSSSDSPCLVFHARPSILRSVPERGDMVDVASQPYEISSVQVSHNGSESSRAATPPLACGEGELRVEPSAIDDSIGR